MLRDLNEAETVKKVILPPNIKKAGIINIWDEETAYLKNNELNDLKYGIFSKEKWDKYESLRIYMLDDLDTNYIWKGADEEYVIKLLGEPFYIKEKNPRYIEYYVSSGNLDPIRFYIMFEDGEVVETGKRHT